MNKLIDIWGKLLISSWYVIWTKARLHFMRVKWSIEDELHIMKSNNSQRKRVETTHKKETNELTTSIIQREKGFI